MKILIAGGGGFIGGFLANRLLAEDHDVVCADIKPIEHWHQAPAAAKKMVVDLRDYSSALAAVCRVEQVYNLAADMGGMGFIETNKLACMLSVLINTNLLRACAEYGVKRYFYASSACVYPDYRQKDIEVEALKESDAYPAMPEDGYGWEKLFSERMCRHFAEEAGIAVRIARYHNVYGAHGTYEGGREKAPAALCRKVAAAKITGIPEIEIWGDGQQTRSFMHVYDCIEGTRRIMDGPFSTPLNLGSSELVSINLLVSIIEDIAEFKVARRYHLDAPQGVRGRNSDNTLITRTLGWAPSIPLKVGLESTYRWIYDRVRLGS
jgi:nucleoside-diphosphate-sugar epimerase